MFQPQPPFSSSSPGTHVGRDGPRGGPCGPTPLTRTCLPGLGSELGTLGRGGGEGMALLWKVPIPASCPGQGSEPPCTLGCHAGKARGPCWRLGSHRGRGRRGQNGADRPARRGAILALWPTDNRPLAGWPIPVFGKGGGGGQEDNMAQDGRTAHHWKLCQYPSTVEQVNQTGRSHTMKYDAALRKITQQLPPGSVFISVVPDAVPAPPAAPGA